MRRETAFLSEISSPVQLTQTCDPAKTVPFHLHGGKSAGKCFHTMRTWHNLTEIRALFRSWHPTPPCKRKRKKKQTHVNVQRWRKAEYFGMKCVGSQRASGWTRFLPIPAFQWRSYFGQCFTRHQAQRREIPRSWKEPVHDTSDTVWGPAARDRC